MSQIVLAVDLDGTLIKTDLIQETIVRFLIASPWRILQLLFWWMRGRAFLKKEVAKRVRVDVSTLPYNTEVLSWLQEEHSRGRRLCLVSGSDQSLVDAVAAHCGIFTDVKGSDGTTNCTGSNKASWLESRYGPRGFDYAGNSGIDLKVWSRANSSVVVSRSAKLGASLPNLSRRFVVADSVFYSLFRSLRVHQWVKALLVFIPLITSHGIFDIAAVLSAIMAFVSFCLMSSSTYILNDLADTETDRANQKKKNRPFASGSLLPFHGLLAFATLFMLSILIAIEISPVFLALILSYKAGTLLYSFYLKSVVVADIVMLAGFYTLRILAGGVAYDILVSKWLLLFSIFFFLGLACIKRFCELNTDSAQSGIIKSRRGYLTSDLPLVRVMGVCSGFLAVLVIALWASSSEIAIFYKSPTVLWLLCPLLLYWIGRIWVIAERGQLHHDPVVFALKDKVSYLVGLIAFLILYSASYFRIDGILK